MKNSTVRDLAAEAREEYRTERAESGKEITATEKEAHEIVDRAFRGLAKLVKSNDIKPSEVLNYLEEKGAEDRELTASRN